MSHLHKEINYTLLYDNVEYIKVIRHYHDGAKLFSIFFNSYIPTISNRYINYKGITKKEVKQLAEILISLNSNIQVDI